MQEIPALITDLTIILVVAALTTLLCKKINLPSVLGYILAGFLAGPVVQFLPTIEDLGSIEVWSDIGVIFLMFGLGLEFSVHKMAEVGVPGFLSAGVQAVGMGAVGVLVGLALGWGTMNSVFLGVMLAMSSTMITMKSIEDLGLKKEPFANLAMGTLVIEDIIAIFAMVILSTIAVSQSISGFALAERIGLLLLYLALWLILGIYLVPTVMKKLVGLMNDEVLLVFSLGLCFLMAVLAEEIGLSTELGAFLAGSLLAGTVHAERVEHLVTPCKNLFGAVFFVSVGFMVQPAMKPTETKKTAPKRFLQGVTRCSTRSAWTVPARREPARNAPSSVDRPISSASTAMRKHRPREKTSRTSSFIRPTSFFITVGTR